MNISTVKKLREYLSDALKLPYDSMKIKISDYDVAQNTTLQNLLEADFSQGIGKAAISNSTIRETKDRIYSTCNIPQYLIRFVKPDGSNYVEQTHIQTVRDDWK